MGGAGILCESSSDGWRRRTASLHLMGGAGMLCESSFDGWRRHTASLRLMGGTGVLRVQETQREQPKAIYVQAKRSA